MIKKENKRMKSGALVVSGTQSRCTGYAELYLSVYNIFQDLNGLRMFIPFYIFPGKPTI